MNDSKPARFLPPDATQFLIAVERHGLPRPRHQITAAFTDGIVGCAYLTSNGYAVVVADFVEVAGSYDAAIWAALGGRSELHIMAPPEDWRRRLTADRERVRFRYERTAFHPLSGDPARNGAVGDDAGLRGAVGRHDAAPDGSALRGGAIDGATDANTARNVRLKDGTVAEIVAIDDRTAQDLARDAWSEDIVAHTMVGSGANLGGFGFVARSGTEILGGIGCYTVYRNGIEVEIDTHRDHRRKGVATALARRMVRACGERGIDCHWDAMNDASYALARKLGFVPAERYECIAVSTIGGGRSVAWNGTGSL